MRDVVFSCPICSRMFLEDCPFEGPVPRHLDPLLGSPCPGSGMPLHGYLEIPDHLHAPWPSWRDWDKMRPRPGP